MDNMKEQVMKYRNFGDFGLLRFFYGVVDGVMVEDGGLVGARGLIEQESFISEETGHGRRDCEISA